MPVLPHSGLPAVTLFGEGEDWDKIRQRLESVGELAEEPAAWYRLRVPVMSHSGRTFVT